MSFTSAYDNTEAQVCMTLASIAYSSENDPSDIRQTIVDNLANTSFATDGDWQLVWLGLTSDNENLAYVAQDTTQPARYAVAIRGTDWCFLVNFIEDFTIFSQSYPGFGPSDLLVADGTLDGLNDVTTVADSESGLTLLQYLQQQYNAGGFSTFDLFVTGHSLGGCLASITFPWLVNNVSGANWNLKAYTFAAPTAGNAAFADYVTSFGATQPYYYWSVVNPRDLAPYAWNSDDLASVVPDSKVVDVTFLLAVELIALISAVIVAEQDNNVSYQQPGGANQFVLTNDLDFSSSCGTPPVSSFDDFKCWVGSEHAGDTYLTLLGATPTNIYYIPDCPATTATPSAAMETTPVAQQQIARWKQNHGQ
jgi:hypothetical protein